MGKIINDQKGFSGIETVMALVIVALIGTVGYLVYHNSQKSKSSTPAVSTAAKPTTTTSVIPAKSSPTGYNEYKDSTLGLAFYQADSWGAPKVTAGVVSTQKYASGETVPPTLSSLDYKDFSVTISNISDYFVHGRNVGWNWYFDTTSKTWQARQIADYTNPDQSAKAPTVLTIKNFQVGNLSGGSSSTYAVPVNGKYILDFAINSDLTTDTSGPGDPVDKPTAATARAAFVQQLTDFLANNQQLKD